MFEAVALWRLMQMQLKAKNRFVNATSDIPTTQYESYHET